MKLDTLCVQGAYKPKSGEPRVIPIVQSTTYKYDSTSRLRLEIVSPKIHFVFGLMAA